MSRWVGLFFCGILGLVMLVGGLLVPAHLRAVNVSVLQLAGRKTPGLVEQGLALIAQNRLGAAQLLAQAARAHGLPGREKLATAANELARQHPGWQVWGGPEPRFESVSSSDVGLRTPGLEPFTEYVIRSENRERILGLLQSSQRPQVQELLRIRASTNTVLFPPSRSSSGQALDAAVGICGLLMEGGYLNFTLSEAVSKLSAEANRGGDSQPFEDLLLNLMSLAQRFNWGQLVVFVAPIQDPETLRLEANLIRRAEKEVPLLFSVVHLTGEPAEVARYVMNFSQTGLPDLAAALPLGSGALKELLRRDKRMLSSGVEHQIARYIPFDRAFAYASDLSWRMPGLALAAKWSLYLVAGFLLAAAMHFGLPVASDLEKPLEVRGFHIAREILFALGFLLVVLLLSEPFLTQDSQKVEFPFRLRLPTPGSLVRAGIANPVKTSFMNQPSLLTLMLFFVLQGLIYTACLVKLAEIRRQRVPARIKLRLLENEDHLFDAGLYLGFVGTIISLILVSLGVIKPSLMAAYSSTSFGIIFVSVFKIFHLRPVRRKLLMEAETAAPEPAASGPRAALVKPT